MTNEELGLFSRADLDTLPKPPMGVGSPVVTPHGSRGRIVAPDLVRVGWWVVKMDGGHVVHVSGDLLDLS